MDNTILLLFLSIPAVWRLSSLVADENGPFDMFNRLRNFALNRSGNSRFFDSLYSGLSCKWCNSVWFSAIFSLFIARSFLEWVVFALFISAMSIVFDRRIIGNG